MIEMFPGIPIFPALGNHESAPVNRYISAIYALKHLGTHLEIHISSLSLFLENIPSENFLEIILSNMI